MGYKIMAVDVIAKAKARAGKSTNPLQAIRAHCLECMGGDKMEIVHCTYEECALFDFRLGKNPRKRLKVLSLPQRLALKKTNQRKKGAIESVFM